MSAMFPAVANTLLIVSRSFLGTMPPPPPLRLPPPSPATDIMNGRHDAAEEYVRGIRSEAPRVLLMLGGRGPAGEGAVRPRRYPVPGTA